MATPPTFVAEYEASSWLNNTTPKTVTPTTVVGDVLVVVGNTEDEAVTLTTPTGNSLTYTLQQSVTVTDFTATYLWTAPDNTGGTGWTLSVSRAGSALEFGFTVARFSGSDGVGASSKTNVTSGAPSLDITTQQDNSAIVVISGDWSAQDGASRTWRTVNGTTPTAGNGFELVYARSAITHAVYVAYYPDAGTAGTKTVGLSAPGSQKYAILAVEIKGAAAPPPPGPALQFVKSNARWA